MITEAILVLKKRFLIFFLVFWIVIVLAAIISFSGPKVFIASAGIVLRDEAVSSHAFDILSDDVLIKTAKKLGMLDNDTPEQYGREVIRFLKQRLNVHMDPNLPVIRVTAETAEMESASLLANTHAECFIRHNMTESASSTLSGDANWIIKRAEKTLRQMTDSRKIAVIEQQLDNRIIKLKKEKERMIKNHRVRHPAIIMLDRSIRDIEHQRDIARDQLILVKKQVHALQDLAAALQQYRKDQQLLDPLQNYLLPAVYPYKDGVRPYLLKNFLFGIAAALILGMIAAGIVEYLDTSLGSYNEVESFLHIPVLGSVPHIERRKKTIAEYIAHAIIRRKRDVLGEQRSRLLFFHPLASSIARAYQRVVHNLDLPDLRRGTAVLCMSAENREGKSVTAANIAVTSAFLGIKTLLIDCDMRFPVIHHWFGLLREHGMADILNGYHTVAECIKPGSSCIFTLSEDKNKLLEAGLNNLFFITAGSKTDAPQKLLSRGGIHDAVVLLKRSFSLIVIDTSSVMHFPDPLLLGRHVDKKVFVYRSGRLSRGLLKKALAEASDESDSVDGIIINDIV